MSELEIVWTDIDAVITRALSDNRIVGTVVLIARDGELVYQRAAGLVDRESGTEMRVDTLFRLASVTKAIVSAAAMALVERDTPTLIHAPARLGQRLDQKSWPGIDDPAPLRG